MSGKNREDFCKVVPRAGSGRAIFVAGSLTVDCTPETPQEVTRAEYEYFLAPTGAFELVTPTSEKE